jgi:group I intron endonuclease
MLTRTKLSSVSGIYQIQSIVNGNIYIGSAINLKRRILKEHFKLLKENKHENSRLQNHVDKYGIEDLQFGVLEFCQNGKLIEREQHYIDTLHPEFNISPTAGSQLGMKHSKETKQKLKDVWKNRGPVSEETKQKMRKSRIGII